jgi:hypothetical protein
MGELPSGASISRRVRSHSIDFLIRTKKNGSGPLRITLLLRFELSISGDGIEAFSTTLVVASLAATSSGAPEWYAYAASLTRKSAGPLFASVIQPSTAVPEAGLMEQEQQYPCPAILP